jgi:hypothetical protein
MLFIGRWLKQVYTGGLKLFALEDENGKKI